MVNNWFTVIVLFFLGSTATGLQCYNCPRNDGGPWAKCVENSAIKGDLVTCNTTLNQYSCFIETTRYSKPSALTPDTNVRGCAMAKSANECTSRTETISQTNETVTVTTCFCLWDGCNSSPTAITTQPPTRPTYAPTTTQSGVDRLKAPLGF